MSLEDRTKFSRLEVAYDSLVQASTEAGDLLDQLCFTGPYAQRVRLAARRKAPDIRAALRAALAEYDV